jgi:hypothetical protein
MDASYWWPMMNQDVHEYYHTCDQCQRTSNMLTQILAKLVTTLHEKPFQKWGLDFIGLVKLIRFGCPLTIVTNQGAHFINNAIKYLNDHFILVLLFIIHKEMDMISL